MCKDPRKAWGTSLAMFCLMADSMRMTMDEIRASKTFCDTHKALNLNAILEICTPLVTPSRSTSSTTP